MSKLPAYLRVQVAFRDKDCREQPLPQGEAIQEAIDLSRDTERPIWLFNAVTGTLAATCVAGRVKAVRS